MLSTHGWAGNLAHAILLAIDQPEASAGRSYNCGDLDQLTLNQIVEVCADALGGRLEVVAVPWEVAGPAKAIGVTGRYHHVLDLSRLRTDLGYRDLLPATEAMARTVRWYAENPPDASIEERLGDPFDYVWEDRMIEHLGAVTAQLRATAQPDGAEPLEVATTDEGGTFRPHPYAHPVAANQARDHRGR